MNTMKQKILLVDDNGDFRSLLEIFLSMKFEVKACENGHDALASLHSGYIPDIIVSDYVMPLMDGKTLIRNIRENNRIKHIPVIIISNISSNDSKEDLIRSGASNYLVKPFCLTDLELCIRNILNVIV
jgi:CheY-like chemotaxis protein